MSFESLSTPLGKQNRAPVATGALFSRVNPALVAIILLASGVCAFGAYRSFRAVVEPIGLARIVRDGTPNMDDINSNEDAPSQLENKNTERKNLNTLNPEIAALAQKSGLDIPANAKIIKVPGSQPSVVASASSASALEQESVPASTTFADPRVSERGRHGILPKIGEGGLMPRTHFARAYTSTGKPMISVVMTGVGISAKSTADAISKLPGAVTLAFAPYGRDLEVQVQRARRDGHEIILQVPMEPLDYPESDPGPHTLRSAEGATENEDRLQWLMSRFTGYIGLMNFMGNKLMANQAAYAPILSELSKRGLLFLDDGMGKKSLTGEISRKVNLPFAQADRIVESGSAAPALRTIFAEIQAVARAKGHAIVTIPALPANIEMVAQWEKEAVKKGFVFAPLSAIVLKPAQ